MNEILTWSRMRLLSKLGIQGQNSSVWLIEDEALGARRVAKFIGKKGLQKAPSQWMDEAKRLYDCRHERVVEVVTAGYAAALPEELAHSPDSIEIDVGAPETAAGSIFITMPHYSAGCLQNQLNRAYTLQVSDAIEHVRAALLGLQYIHSKRLVHLDVKPSNLLIDDRGKTRLADFGQAVTLDAHGFGVQDRVYVFHKPPEMLTDSGLADIRADVYQAGATLCRLLNGDVNFRKRRQALEGKWADLRLAIRSGRFPDRETWLPHIPKRVREIVRKSMQVRPENRFATASDMLDALAKVDSALCAWQCNSWDDAGSHFHSVVGDRTKHSLRVWLESGSGWRCEVLEHLSNGNTRKVNEWGRGPCSERDEVDDHVAQLFEQFGAN